MTLSRTILTLARALRKWKCPACGGKGTYLNRGFRNDPEARKAGPQLIKGKFYNEEVPCTKCGGNGLHPIAAEALTSAGITIETRTSPCKPSPDANI